MQALVIIPEQRNHYHRHPGNRSKSSAPHFSSPPASNAFGGMNCRSFYSGRCAGVLLSPPPPPAHTYSSPERKTPKQQQPRLGVKKSRPISISPSTSPPSRVLPSPPPPPARTNSSPEPKTPKQQPRHGGKRSRPISISPSTSPPSHSELWAGPAFSNSPPPSSLPIPKFSLRQNRSISLELPPVERSDDVEVGLHAKSAPSSPVEGSGYDFFNDDAIASAIATENLRRILQLDITDH